MGHKLANYGPATTFASYTARWISMLSFFVTLLRLVSESWKKAILWFFLLTCVSSYFAASIIQSFFVCSVSHLVGEDRCVQLEIANAYALYVSIYGTVVVSFFLFTIFPLSGCKDAVDITLIPGSVADIHASGLYIHSRPNHNYLEDTDDASGKSFHCLRNEYWFVVSCL